MLDTMRIIPWLCTVRRRQPCSRCHGCGVGSWLICTTRSWVVGASHYKVLAYPGGGRLQLLRGVLCKAQQLRGVVLVRIRIRARVRVRVRARARARVGVGVEVRVRVRVRSSAGLSWLGLGLGLGLGL
eukprot:scaffold118748_cov45-Phaeocystis_antarctica.AAC.2